MKTKDRYFIVMYVSNCSKGHVKGQTSFKTDGGYLNKSKSTEMLKGKGFKDENQYVITNIIELSKSDYEDWIE